jgi:hypothetical protein
LECPVAVAQEDAHAAAGTHLPSVIRVPEVGDGEVELAIPREITRHQRLRIKSRSERHRRLERAIAVAQEDHD